MDIRVETCGAIYPLDKNETKQKKKFYSWIAWKWAIFSRGWCNRTQRTPSVVILIYDDIIFYVKGWFLLVFFITFTVTEIKLIDKYKAREYDKENLLISILVVTTIKNLLRYLTVWINSLNFFKNYSVSLHSETLCLTWALGPLCKVHFRII